MITDAKRVEEIRVLMRSVEYGDVGCKIATRPSLEQGRFLLAQYDTLKAENEKMREALEYAAEQWATNEGQHFGCDCFESVMRVICKALGREWRWWRKEKDDGSESK